MASKVTTPESNNQLINQYVANMQAQTAQGNALINQLQTLSEQQASLEQSLALEKQLESLGLAGKGDVARAQAALDQKTAQVNSVTAQLEAIDPMMANLCSEIATLENGLFTTGVNGDGNQAEDMKMFSNYLTQITAAMKQQLVANEWTNKMALDGDDNNALIQDSCEAINAASQESGILSNLQDQMCKDLVALNDQKNKAETDLKSYRWYDDALSFGTDEDDKEKDRAIIRNSNDMSKMILSVMSGIGGEIATLQTENYKTVTLALDKILQQMEQILSNASLSTNEKGDQIKCLMALALGILSMVQTEAAKEKAENQQTESNSATYATEMTLSDQKAEYQQLMHDLAYAKTMGDIMKIAKPLMEVAGCIIAPGMGTMLVMAMLMVADETGGTDKLTNYLAKHGLKQVGAEAVVGGMEAAATLGGGLALDKGLQVAGEKAAQIGANSAQGAAKEAIEEAVQKALTETNKVGDKAAEESVRKVVTDAVNEAIKSSGTKLVIELNSQPVALLIPQLFKTAALKTMIKETAELAAQNAAEQVSFLAEAAANGAKIIESDITAVSNRAANDAVAKQMNTTGKEVANATERSLSRRTFSRAAAVATYVTLNDGALSSGVIAAMKAADFDKKNETGFMAISALIKALEGILASFAFVLYGTGQVQAGAGEDSTFPYTLMKLARGAQTLGMGANGISSAGMADAQMQEASAVKAINQSSVNNDMLQMYLQRFNQQGQIDRKNVENQLSEQASNYTMISQLENSGREAAQVLAVQAV